uniref:Trehalose 6-phosphate phosphatase n=1 Tax=Cicer arietinum TaxID=3827 RepID=A0A3Q7YFJ8_CICAR|nr:probable trehalose-phosphate phosphatase 2 isoform X2 [Cicer arietinum]
MKHMIFLLVTFKIIKKKLTKLRESMGFQTTHNTKRISQPILKAKEEASDSHEPRGLNLTHHTLTNTNFIPYDSWLMRTAVREVATYFPTAIISGRSREKVKDFVKLNNLYYAGSHGMDIMAPSMPIRSSDGKQLDTILDTNGNEVPFQPAKKFLPAIQEILRRLENVIKDIEGAKIEDNGFCISVHFRQVHEKDYNVLEEKVKSVLGKNPLFCVTEGKKVMEIRPSIEWNKGNAVEYFLDTLGLSSSNNILPVYIGDDKTDEDAFKVIQTRGQGYPIIVSSIPRETSALYSLHDPSEVLIFLSRLAKWKKASCSRRPLKIGN